MPKVYPFHAIQYQSGRGDVTTRIAPPYDVLDASSKAALLAKDASNIVAVDLPHTPAKALGPAQAYENAAAQLNSWLSNGTLTKRTTPAIFAYRQTTRTPSGTATSQRCGMAVCVDAVPFGPRQGGGVLPHEETFSGPKEDRMALMKATGTQLSPVFGLHADEAGKATAIVRGIMKMRAPDMTAQSGDGVLHELWTIDDAPTIASYQEALGGEDIFIADGHHRYTTGLNYLAQLEAQGPVAKDHPARRSMMVLVGMSDPGLIIWPTHRVLGGMANYSLEAFTKAAAEFIRTEPFSGSLTALEQALEARADLGEMRFALYDFSSKTGLLARPITDDPLAARFPEKPLAWRQLVVAYIQYVLVERIAQPALNSGNAISWAFPHTIAEVEQIGSGTETGAGGGKGFAQLAVIVRSTPLTAVRDVSRANQLMPQKSTFFYPKLATGLFLHALHP
jgi:uncharacterized protein (DUF1015 family)